MEFAVVQESPDPPSVDQLRRAFESCAFLTKHDAVTLTRNAYGILLRGLSRENAHVLVRALETAGVATTVVEQGALPALPAPNPNISHKMRIFCLRDGLTVCRNGSYKNSESTTERPPR